MARGSVNPRPVLTSTPRTGLGTLLDYHKIGYLMLLTIAVFLVLSGVIFVLAMYLWQAKQDLKASKKTEKFWFNKWATEVHANLELHQLYDTAINMISDWRLKFEESEANYKALEQGRDEESEAYEMQFLSFSETLEAQANAIQSLGQQLETHDWCCLPRLDEGVILATDLRESSPVYDSLWNGVSV